MRQKRYTVFCVRVLFVSCKSFASAACFALAITAIVGMPGCSSRRGVKTYPVTVEVSFPDGSTLEGAIVAFQSLSNPDAGEKRRSVSAIGKVGSDGTCQLTTYTRGDGAVAGRHRVTVAPPPMSGDPDETGRLRPKIHPRFLRSATSGLEVSVSADGPNKIPIEIERP